MDFDEAVKKAQSLRANLGKVVKGHEAGLDATVIAILARGHVLLESVPGEGKTLLATVLAASISGITTGRISGQPTLKPSDLLGAEVLGRGTGQFQLIKGPIFNNIVLFDELNRTDPRTQSGARCRRQTAVSCQDRMASTDTAGRISDCERVESISQGEH